MRNSGLDCTQLSKPAEGFQAQPNHVSYSLWQSIALQTLLYPFRGLHRYLLQWWPETYSVSKESRRETSSETAKKTHVHPARLKQSVPSREVFRNLLCSSLFCHHTATSTGQFRSGPEPLSIWWAEGEAKHGIKLSIQLSYLRGPINCTGIERAFQVKSGIHIRVSSLTSASVFI